MIDTKEIKLEEAIENHMLSHGYMKGDQETYNKEKAIDLSKMIEFIEKTQPNEWKKYKKMYGAEAEKKLYDRFEESVEKEGLLYVLRHGIKDRGVTLHFVAFKPETTLNQKIIENYNANILECTRQFKYSIKNENSIDMVLSINGIPVVALELKNQLSGQNIDNAKLQYMNDRDPKELCFMKRILVYFAVDLYEVAMTTTLKGKNTFFLPFNQGSNGAGNVGGAGNPDVQHGYVTSYLWEKVLQRDMLLELVQRYIHVGTEIEIDGNGEKYKKTKVIFPRFHQLDVVTKLINDVQKNGPGKNYLIQHSAGSGKSNSIAWLAYGLANLHRNNKKIFNSIIVVTDRTVLDSQLQDTIYSFDHTKGLVEKIDGTSRDLRDAINDGKKIIITTLQKFPQIYTEIEGTKGKSFAVIVDEAHSSQTGSNAAKLKQALADTEAALAEFASEEGKEENEREDLQDFIVREMVAHGKQSNLSFFAFTATPKKATLEMFGEKQPDGTFVPFHIYSMKQAIEEGFILDVLNNYASYKTYFNLTKTIKDNPELPSSDAVKALKKYESLHPYHLGKKTEVMMEFFLNNTRNKIGGKAKAMVVTPSRLHAVKYFQHFNEYIKRNKIEDINVLVAFSGTVKENDIEYTEEGLNRTKDGKIIKERQLPEEFHKDGYSILIVAEKYQTGFDEPLLHTMFVDKRLHGVKAVQTLSRLNRTCSEKHDTFILDFANNPEDIQNAFKPYYEATVLDGETDPNMIYDIQSKIREYGLYDETTVENFMDVFSQRGEHAENDMAILSGIFKSVINKYCDLDKEEKYCYKGLIKSFNKWYGYISQIVSMGDRELQEEYHFTHYLQKLLPEVRDLTEIDLEGKVKLNFMKLKKTYEGSITLADKTADSTLVHGVGSLSLQPLIEPKYETLDDIIKQMNKAHMEIFTEDDKVMLKKLYNSCKEDEGLYKFAKESDDEYNFKHQIFNKRFQDIIIENYNEFSAIVENEKFNNKKLYNEILDVFSTSLYKEFNKLNS